MASEGDAGRPLTMLPIRRCHGEAGGREVGRSQGRESQPLRRAQTADVTTSGEKKYIYMVGGEKTHLFRLYLPGQIDRAC